MSDAAAAQRSLVFDTYIDLLNVERLAARGVLCTIYCGTVVIAVPVHALAQARRAWGLFGNILK
jgi:hypothetical protein